MFGTVVLAASMGMQSLWQNEAPPIAFTARTSIVATSRGCEIETRIRTAYRAQAFASKPALEPRGRASWVRLLAKRDAVHIPQAVLAGSAEVAARAVGSTIDGEWILEAKVPANAPREALAVRWNDGLITRTGFATDVAIP
jgi:hypothetical protein